MNNIGFEIPIMTDIEDSGINELEFKKAIVTANKDYISFKIGSQEFTIKVYHAKKIMKAIREIKENDND